MGEIKFYTFDDIETIAAESLEQAKDYCKQHYNVSDDDLMAYTDKIDPDTLMLFEKDLVPKGVDLSEFEESERVGFKECILVKMSLAFEWNGKEAPYVIACSEQ